MFSSYIKKKVLLVSVVLETIRQVYNLIDKECFCCKNRGHIAKACQKKAKAESKANPHPTNITMKSEK